MQSDRDEQDLQLEWMKINFHKRNNLFGNFVGLRGRGRPELKWMFEE